MPKKFTFRGLTLEELQRLSLEDFAKLLPARQRRSIQRGLPLNQKKVLANVKHAKEMREKGEEVIVRTHCREMVVLPEMVGLKFGVHNGKDFVVFEVKPEMIGHRLGEFSQTRKRVTHGTPGIGATRSSMYVPLK